MSRERELLEALKRSTDSDILNGAQAAPEVADGVSNATHAAVTHAGHAAGGYDLGSVLNVTGDIATSFMADPLFYMKAVGILLIGLVILSYSVDLIFGN